jgi:hypothetical protein
MGIEAALLASAAASLIGGGMQASAARSAARTQAQSAREAADLTAQLGRENLAFQREVYGKGLELSEPYRQAGYGALTRIGELLPGLTTPVSREEILGLPGYQFAIEQGTGAARQAMNVGGGGSNVDRAAQKFAIDYTLGTAMPQVIAQRQNIYNTLAGIAGLGQTGSSQGITAGQAAGTNIGNIYGSMAGNLGQAAIGAGSALAAGQIGSANAIAGGLGNIGNTALMYNLLQRQPTVPASIPTPG